ncbi:Two component system response regulator [Desulfonema limicola]|uniref:Two component system response regulator n=1 Tax=Desulfonema limicola TaxID=45656 RepID=A0A975B9F2_9BACT|nr:ABC transporter substrate-binding protein [Desulfonema limicola]QTA81111.1 Two component system response regulator [Desulfonema limicola]
MTVNYEMKILVVEDFNATRKMEIKLLNRIGFSNIIEAVNGDDAIQKLKSDINIDLIISDWNMPVKSGYELLKWVRSNENCQNIPFIMATAQAEKKEAGRADKAGVTYFITKPYTQEELKQIIFNIFCPDEKKQAEPAAAAPVRKNRSGKTILRVGHIQITDHLVLGVLNHMIKTGDLFPKYFELETRCMPGWNPVQKSLENGELDAAFILAPIAMDLFSFGVPVQLILLAHKNGSICIKNKQNKIQSSFRSLFKNKVFYIPHVLSVHHMFAHMFFREIGLIAGLIGKNDIDISFEVVSPVKIPDFMKNNPDSGGFMVAQPIGAKTIARGFGELLFLSGEMWPYHPCCVLAMQKEIINTCEDAVYEFTEMLVKAGMFIEENPEISARIAVDFLDPQKKLRLSEPVLGHVLTETHGIKTDDLYPDINDFEKIQQYMYRKMGIGTLIDLEKFIDTRFAHQACKKNFTEKRSSIFKDPSFMVQQIKSRILEG